MGVMEVTTMVTTIFTMAVPTAPRTVARGSSANALIDDLICILDFYCFLASQGHPKNFLFFCAPDRRWAESQGLPMMTDLLQVMMDPVSTRATMMDLCRAMTVPI